MSTNFIWVIVGAVSIIAGIVALANPLAASLTATMITAWGFLLVGVLNFIAIFRSQGFLSRVWTILLALAFIITGAILFRNPLSGLMSITLIVGILFAFIGISRVLIAFALPKNGIFWIVVLSGALSIIMSIMIFTNFPQSSVITLGVLLAVELISNGVALISLGTNKRIEHVQRV